MAPAKIEWPVPEGPLDPLSFAALLPQHLEWMRSRGFAEGTVRCRFLYVRSFAIWCEERAITRPGEVTPPVIERYQRWLYHYRKKSEVPLSIGSQHNRVGAVRTFFRWLARHRLIAYNPASEIDLPRLPTVRLPKSVLTAAEAERVMHQPDLSTPRGIRDRAMLETFYSTGMRRTELRVLKLYDIDMERGTVMIREGKGKKDRVVPIGERALSFIDRYLREVRPTLAMEPDDGTIFLTETSEPFGADHLSSLVRDYVLSARIGKEGACHLFRHTAATLMLENGADIRYIQEMLGHAKLSTTQIYTRVSIKKLKEIHTATHPAARLEPCTEAAAAVAEDLDAEASSREDLLLTLAAEAAEEGDA